MTREPVLIGRRELATSALDLMESRKITALLVASDAGRHRGRPPPPRPLEDRDDMKDEALAERCRALKLVLTRRGRRDDRRDRALLPDGARGQGVPHPRRPGESCSPTRPACGPASSPGAPPTRWRAAPPSWGWRWCARACATREAALREILAELGITAPRGGLHRGRRQRPPGLRGGGALRRSRGRAARSAVAGVHGASRPPEGVAACASSSRRSCAPAGTGSGPPPPSAFNCLERMADLSA